MEVGEGLGHVDPKALDIFRRQQTYGVDNNRLIRTFDFLRRMRRGISRQRRHEHDGEYGFARAGCDEPRYRPVPLGGLAGLRRRSVYHLPAADLSRLSAAMR